MVLISRSAKGWDNGTYGTDLVSSLEPDDPIYSRGFVIGGIGRNRLPDLRTGSPPVRHEPGVRHRKSMLATGPFANGLRRGARCPILITEESADLSSACRARDKYLLKRWII